jgi:DNA-binding HxlR family transcriptional regulator
MPDFVYDYKMFYNPVEFALKYIGGTWKMPILWRLNKATMRYSELKQTLPHITHKMLSSQLKELGKNGMISKRIYASVPPKTEYSITEEGKKAIPVIENLRKYGLMLMKQKGIDVVNKRAAKKVSQQNHK